MSKRLREVHQGKPPTAREIEILQAAADGESAGETARRLWLSEETVRTHRKRASAKLGKDNLPSAVAEGFRRGIIV